ncbi:MAG: hypothetical protein AAGA60_26320 [Cyanobacteria bacterium P01_E01_bin.42]
MLDVSFYSKQKNPSCHVEVAEDFLEWLAKSDFSQIGQEKSLSMSIDGELILQSVVELDRDRRQKFIDCFNSLIVAETKELLAKIESLANQSRETYRVKKLIELLDCIKNEEYWYLRRV